MNVYLPALLVSERAHKGERKTEREALMWDQAHHVTHRKEIIVRRRFKGRRISNEIQRKCCRDYWDEMLRTTGREVKKAEGLKYY